MGSLNLILKISLAPALENSTISFRFGTCLYMRTLTMRLERYWRLIYLQLIIRVQLEIKKNIVQIAFYRDLTTKFTFDDLNHRRDLSGS